MGVIAGRSIIRQSSGSASFCGWPQYPWSMTSLGGRPQRPAKRIDLKSIVGWKLESSLFFGLPGLTQETRLLDRIQHDHRYLAVGLELIVGVGWPEFERLRPKPEPLLARRCPGACFHLLGPDLYVDVGVRQNVAIPPWVLGRASL